MTGNIELTIDDQKVEVAAGSSVLEAALTNDISIPHLCHHPDLKPAGACRTCGVEIDGGRMAMSCQTPVAAGMKVRTSSPAVDHARRTTLELLISDHYTDCLACPINTDCDLLKAAAHVGISRERLERMRGPSELLPVDRSNPFFEYDPNKCIVCGICVRTCDEIVGLGVLDFVNRGYRTVIGTFGNKPFIDSVCESCGECVVRCPVSALAPKQAELPAREVQTTCVYCGVGCGIYLGVKGNRVVSARGDRQRPSNQGSLCVKGRYGYRFINHPERLATPLIKNNGRFDKASWDEALDLIAKNFTANKGEQFAAFTSAKCTNEENYLLQKFTRAVMRTNTIDHCARL